MLLLKIIKRTFFIFPLTTLLLVCKISSANGSSEINTPYVEVNKLAEIDKIGTKVNPSQLPSPYNDLLTQPLMTKAIEKYYGRTAIVKTIEAHLEQSSTIYHRSIIMLVDKNKERNQPELAQTKKEVIVAELAFITINFNELPKTLVDDVLHTNIPFGRLLTQYDVQVLTQDRNYFKVSCNRTLATFIHCPLNQSVYGRTNTIIRADNKKWLAHVVEILPNPSQ
ncbi:hypothetical protein Lgra_1618 [Legionella gratiana]|uniref:Uncharacterized protein n=1 Tax=Legionella gratiana TaxID=45066 RepID=A0A378J9H8_9GAMM|nr:hypothetical protein [Legionella gratiana]KTD10652.1 hypothetical protein Lgra_1618 [Legionella gratiana]STX43621.1 Uncharacterised protein [Legionella gratiana]